MNALERLCSFEYFDPGTTFSCDEGWQYVPMQMIFNVKHDLRRKVCFVVGGHIIDSTGHVTYLLTIKDLFVRLMLLIAVKHDLGFMAGGDFLREMGFVPSRADQDLWLQKLEEHVGYDYIATH
eukprot:12043440-Ditylum_brightwellii.AAC.1